MPLTPGSRELENSAFSKSLYWFIFPTWDGSKNLSQAESPISTRMNICHLQSPNVINRLEGTQLLKSPCMSWCRGPHVKCAILPHVLRLSLYRFVLCSLCTSNFPGMVSGPEDSDSLSPSFKGLPEHLLRQRVPYASDAASVFFLAGFHRTLLSLSPSILLVKNKNWVNDVI